MDSAVNNYEFSNIPALSKLLPECPYKVTHFEKILPTLDIEEERFTATIRLPCSTKEAVLDWICKYESKSLNTFRTFKTYPESEMVKNVFKRIYRCQHKTNPRSVTADQRRGSKNTNCPAQLTVTVKKFVKYSRSKDEHRNGYPTIVNLRYLHNHPINAADALKHRDVPEKLKKKFLELFRKGHSPESALGLHKYDLQVELKEDHVYTAADRSKVPDVQTLYRLYYNCFKKAYDDSQTSVLRNLEDLILQLNQADGDCVKMDCTSDNQLVIGICTPLMKRVLSTVKQSGKFMFVDSTGNVDGKTCRIFLLMTFSCSGGLPVGCLIVTKESSNTIKAALSLYLQLIPDGGFYGRGSSGPELIITDDNDAQRTAFHAEFQCSTLLLCTFQVLQATWRWLWESKHGIDEEDRPVLFTWVKDMLYANDLERMDNMYAFMLTNGTVIKYTTFQDYVMKLYSCKEQWSLCYRQDIPVRGNNTNNYCEAAIRVLKDHVQQRSKAFNVVQLLDFVSTRMMDFYEQRLLGIANNRLDHCQYSKFLPPASSIDQERISFISETQYSVTSSSDDGIVYTVNTEVGLCSCNVGLNGTPCKHQAAVLKKFHVTSLNYIPVNDLEERNALCYIATGRRMNNDWFKSLHQHDTTTTSSASDDVMGSTSDFSAVSSNEYGSTTSASDSLDQQRVLQHPYIARTAHHQTTGSQEQPIHTTVKNDLREYFDLLSKKLDDNPECYAPAFESFIKSGKKLRTDASLLSALNCFGKFSGLESNYLKRKNSGNLVLKSGLKTIGMQPTAISRRKMPNQGRSSRGRGRPRKLSNVQEQGKSSQGEGCPNKSLNVQEHGYATALPNGNGGHSPQSSAACVTETVVWESNIVQ